MDNGGRDDDIIFMLHCDWGSMKLDNLSGEGDAVRLLDLVERKNEGDKINKWIKEEEKEKVEKGRRKKGVGGKGL